MANLKNVNLMSQDIFESITPSDDELYAVSASGIGFPSSRYEDLTLGASGTQYTAPANGYFYFGKAASATNQYVDMYNKNSKYRLQTSAPVSGMYCLQAIPARKGDVVKVNYNLAGVTEGFRFIYAEGE